VNGDGYKQTYQNKNSEYSQECYEALVKTFAKKALPSDIEIF